ncbi:MAG: DUF3617 domain-containing protein [Pseudomonadota bacterium]
MKPVFCAAALAIVVAGCSDSSDISTADADADGDGSVSLSEANEAVQNAGGAIKPKAGQYRASVEMIEASMPGMSADAMGAGNFNTTVEYCVSPEEAENGFEEMMSQGQEGDCSYESFNLDGNQLDAVLVCNAGGGKMKMAMEGTVSATKTDTTMTMTSDIPGVGETTMKMKNSAEWVGECAEG